MFKENDYLVYKRDVCKVVGFKKHRKTGEDYYVLAPLGDASLIIKVPADNKLGFIRKVLSKSEAEKLILSIPEISELDNMEDRFIEKTYKKLLYSGTHEDLIVIIKTTFLRNQNRLENNKKAGDKDTKYFKLAEKYLYNELSVSLGKSYDETKEYVLDKVQKLKNK